MTLHDTGMGADLLRRAAAQMREDVEDDLSRVWGMRLFTLAVADWLDATADLMDHEPAGLALASVREQTTHPALAVARAYLGKRLQEVQS